MKKRLEAKVAVVTASTEGIGYAIAESMAENGASVVISSRKEDNVQKAVKSLTEKGLPVTGCVCHVGKAEDRKRLIEKAIETYGRIDIMVSNAAISPYVGKLLEMPEKSWDKVFDINLKAGFLLAKEAKPHLQKTKGSMLFISSIGGYNPASDMIGAYAISKTALLGLTKTLSFECAKEGVRVNCLAPGLISTNFSSAIENSSYGNAIKKTIPMMRAGTPEEVAGAAVFLSSHEASYITGETIVMSGGMASRL